MRQNIFISIVRVTLNINYLFEFAIKLYFLHKPLIITCI